MTAKSDRIRELLDDPHIKEAFENVRDKYRAALENSDIPDDDVLEIGINRAVDLLAEAAKKAGRLLGTHPSGGEVHVKKGRFGPYVEHNKLRATLGKAHDIADISLETALELLAAKAAKGPATPKKAAPKKKTAPKKTTTKKTATKKTGVKKAATKKIAAKLKAV